MKKKLLFILSVFIFLSGHSRASGPGEIPEVASPDREQQQLHWCFLYSNLFGYNISYISNPRLYQSISEWMGVPYKYSGCSKKGIDCSGLVCEIISDCYKIKLEGCARDLYKSSQQLRRSELREGDLVFFKIKKRSVSHVGIYLGQNRFVHASLQNGVIVSDLDDPYYQKYFFKGGRIING